jgi:6,7-dimethyl-8-ribityllumazine synthase
MTRQTKIAYVQAAWHADITDRCKEAFIAELARHGYDQSGIEFFSAPGSLEIPLMAKKLAKTGKYAAVCASGFVVDGGIYRHEFVAQAVLQGIVQTSLETEVPILSAVLTPAPVPRSCRSSRVLPVAHGHQGQGAGRRVPLDHREPRGRRLGRADD